MTLMTALHCLLISSAAVANTDGVDQRITPPNIPHEKYTLSNGLTVILHEDHSTPIVATNIWYHVGSKDERPGRTGFAHLFEHMMFQGSKNYNQDFFKAIEALGATDLNGTTRWDRTNYFQVVPSHALERVLWLEADRMFLLLPALSKERLDNQREVVKNERRQAVDNEPYGLARERLDAALYPAEHPYSRPIYGSMEDLSAASVEDVAAFFKEFYGPNNATLVIAGDFEPGRAKEMVERYFGEIPPGPPLMRRKQWIPELRHEVRLEMDDRVSLPRLYVAWHAPARFSEGEAELDILAQILGQGQSSRLQRRLVHELKLAQSVVVANPAREIGGQFQIIVTAAPGASLDRIEPLVFEEVARIQTTPPSTIEIERARSAILGGIVRASEGLGGYGGRSEMLAEYQAFLGESDFIERDFLRYHRASSDGVRAVAQRWLHGGRVVLRVTPRTSQNAGKPYSSLDRGVAPELGPPPTLKLPTLQRTQLRNGLKVILAENHRTPTVQLYLAVPGGGLADPPGRPGLSALTTTLLLEGSGRRSALEVREETDLLGAKLVTFAGPDLGGVWLDALKSNLAGSVGLLADLVRDPAFRPSDVMRKRDELLGQIATERSDPQALAMRLLPRLAYGPDHPYGLPISISASMTSETLRAVQPEDLVRHHQTWFRPNRSLLVVAGDTALAELVPELERSFGKWSPAPSPDPKVPGQVTQDATQMYLVDKPGAAQSFLAVGQLVPSRSDPERTAFDVLHALLAGQFTSRINMNLREQKGYTYGAWSMVVPAKGQSLMTIMSAVRSDVTSESLHELLEELRAVREHRPPTPDEVAFAQSNLILALPGSFSTSDRIAGRVVEALHFGLPDDFYSKYPAAVNSTTPESLAELAKRWLLPDRLAILIIGDRAEVESKLKALNLGPIQLLDEDGRVVK